MVEVNPVSLEFEFNKIFEKLADEMFEPLRGNVEGMPLGKFKDQWLSAWFPMYWPQVKKFPVHKEDIIVASFPNSGEHWVRCAAFLIETGNFDDAPKLDQRMTLELPRPPIPSTLDKLAAQPGNRMLTTTLSASLLPEEIFKGRLIYVYRNAKDVAAACYNYDKKSFLNDLWPANSTFDQYIETFMGGKVYAGPYPDHLKGYFEMKKQGKALFVLSYQSIEQDPKGVIQEMARFLEKDVDDQTVDKIFEACNCCIKNEGQFCSNECHLGDSILLERFNRYVAENVPHQL